MAAQLAKNEIERLIARADAARSSLTRSAETLRAKFDAPARIRASLRANPSAWLAAATATGLLTSRILFRRRPKKSAKSKHGGSILIFLIKAITGAITPALKILLLAQIKSYINRRTTPSHISKTY